MVSRPGLERYHKCAQAGPGTTQFGVRPCGKKARRKHNKRGGTYLDLRTGQVTDRPARGRQSGSGSGRASGSGRRSSSGSGGRRASGSAAARSPAQPAPRASGRARRPPQRLGS